MNDRDLTNFVEIVSCCDDVLDKIDYFKIDYKVWVHNVFVRDSVLLSISRIGELVTHFKTSEYQSLFPQIPWHMIKAMRNYIVHDYKNVDLDAAWDAATNDVPKLKDVLLSNETVRAQYEVERTAIAEDIDSLIDGLDSL